MKKEQEEEKREEGNTGKEKGRGGDLATQAVNNFVFSWKHGSHHFLWVWRTAL